MAAIPASNTVIGHQNKSNKQTNEQTMNNRQPYNVKKRVNIYNLHYLVVAFKLYIK